MIKKIKRMNESKKDLLSLILSSQERINFKKENKKQRYYLVWAHFL